MHLELCNVGHAGKHIVRSGRIALTKPQVVISTNIENGADQRVDMEIVDGSNHRNVYQSKKDIKGETRMAITTHADADLGVCFTNHLREGAIPSASSSAEAHFRVQESRQSHPR